MKTIKKIAKGVLFFLLIPLSYFLISLLLSAISIHKESSEPLDNTIFLSTNGVHLDIVLPIQEIDSLLLRNLKYQKSDQYLSFGWGDEDFYINTPTWDDLTFNTAFSALFLKSSSLMHLTPYRQKQKHWVAIKVSRTSLDKINTYLQKSFKLKDSNTKIILKNTSYSATDSFYKAEGSYSCFNTCNSWVNTGFKESGLKAAYWTPFDFGLLNKYK